MSVEEQKQRLEKNIVSTSIDSEGIVEDKLIKMLESFYEKENVDIDSKTELNLNEIKALGKLEAYATIIKNLGTYKKGKKIIVNPIAKNNYDLLNALILSYKVKKISRNSNGRNQFFNSLKGILGNNDEKRESWFKRLRKDDI